MPPIGFIDDDDEHLGVLGFRLPSLPMLRGRSGVAIPTGLVLPEAKDGATPYTYSMSDLPGGVTFTAGTRTLSGTPNAAGDFTPTYTVTDSSTPALSVSKTFDWSVLDVLATDHIALQDFDEGKIGYGISDFALAYAVVLESGNDAGFANTNLWRIPPAGNAVGSSHDDPYTTYGLNPEGTIITRLWWRGDRNPPRPVLVDSDTDADGNAAPLEQSEWWAANPTRGLYFQRATGAPGVDLGAASSSGGTFATWNSLTATQAAWVRANLNDGNRFLLVIA